MKKTIITSHVLMHNLKLRTLSMVDYDVT